MRTDRQNPSVIIIGAGMTGIQLVIKLREAGITDITVLEKKESMGGTWRENTYPGVACDVPSHAYTYSFELNPEWSNYFPGGDEIYQYFEKVFYKYGVNYCTRFNEKVTSCVFDEQTQRWTVTTEKGEVLQADLLFSATGILHEPVIPDFPGLDRFAGKMFHTARWDNDYDMGGKKVSVIGVGSSAVQLIPEIIDTPGTKVTVFQRTPQWIVSLKDRVFTEKDKERFRRQPWRMKWIRELSLFSYRQNTAALTGDSLFNKIMHRIMARIARKNLESSVRDPLLRAKLTPDYKFGCKRVVINSTFYEAIQKPNAQLVTEGIDHFTEQGIVTSDGVHHQFDVIVLATGFNPAAFMRPMTFLGREGLSINEAWERKIQAYRSICLPGFPNFFLMLGPNSPIGNYSVIEMSELQSDYAIKLVKHWQKGQINTIEASLEAMQRWCAMLKHNMKKTVWTSGCQSWYLDADGDALAWPDNWNNWVEAMREPNLNDFLAESSEAVIREEVLSDAA